MQSAAVLAWGAATPCPPAGRCQSRLPDREMLHGIAPRTSDRSIPLNTGRSAAGLLLARAARPDIARTPTQAPVVSPINAEVKSETAPADRSRCMTPLASTGMSLGHHGLVRDVSIRDDTIRLGQALKLTGLAGSGGEARALIEDDAVRVNGEVETRRGRQLRRGDVVALGSEEVRIA